MQHMVHSLCIAIFHPQVLLSVALYLTKPKFPPVGKLLFGGRVTYLAGDSCCDIDHLSTPTHYL